MSKNKIATIISRVCEPMVLLTITAVIAGFHTGLASSALWQYFISLFFFMIAPVIGLWAWFAKKEGMSWDIPDRAKRVRPLVVVLGFVLLNGILTLRFHVPALTQLFFLFLVWLVGFTLITTKWKISGHT